MLKEGDVVRFGATVECLFELSDKAPSTVPQPMLWDVPAHEQISRVAKPTPENRLPVPKPAQRTGR